MSGWAILILLAAVLAAALVLLARPSRPMLMLLGAAVAIACAGYAWQGHPGLAGRPTRPQDTAPPADNLFASERKEWLETVGPDPQLLDAADQLIARGDADYAIGTIRAALAQRPNSAMLWLGLGNALVHYADGAMTPPARYAFDRAASLAPGNPAPPFFLGLAEATSGDLAGADAIWSKLLAEAPADARWRPRLLARLFLLRQIEMGAR